MEVKDWQVIPDDRVTLIQTIGGVAVQDFGHVEEGDKFSCKVTLHKADAEIIYNYWHNRTRVTVEDQAGNIFENMRVIVKNYSYLDGFKKYYKATLEFWRK